MDRTMGPKSGRVSVEARAVRHGADCARHNSPVTGGAWFWLLMRKTRPKARHARTGPIRAACHWDIRL